MTIISCRTRQRPLIYAVIGRNGKDNTKEQSICWYWCWCGRWIKKDSRCVTNQSTCCALIDCVTRNDLYQYEINAILVE